MAKPSSHLDWTVGNPTFGTVTVEPTGGKKITGWTPGEAPPPEYMNWIAYNSDQWDKYLETTTDNILNRLAGVDSSIAAIAGSLYSTNLVQEKPSGTTDGTNTQFTLSQVPSNPSNVFVYIDGVLMARSTYTITGRNVVFNGGDAPGADADVLAVYVIQTGFSGQSAATSLVGVTPKTETRTVSPSEATSGNLSLSLAPYDATNTIVDVIGDGPQAYGIDYAVTGSVLSWSGLGMAPTISAGAVLRIQYFV